MAEGQRMTAADVVAQVRDGRLEDFVPEAVVLVARELMEAEISAEVGAELGEVAPELRVTHRNGYRPRAWETRVGEIDLLIPRKRQGSYFPSFLEPRRRSEQAIVAVVLEAYVNGVSTTDRAPDLPEYKVRGYGRVETRFCSRAGTRPMPSWLVASDRSRRVRVVSRHRCRLRCIRDRS